MNKSRRHFLKTNFALLASIPALGALWSDCTKSAELPAGEKKLAADDAVGKALGYSESASDVDTNKFPKRKSPEGDKQFCKSCNFYTAKNDDWGKCTILQNGLVAANGWCNNWTAKPGA